VFCYVAKCLNSRCPIEYAGLTFESVPLGTARGPFPALIIHSIGRGIFRYENTERCNINSRTLHSSVAHKVNVFDIESNKAKAYTIENQGFKLFS